MKRTLGLALALGLLLSSCGYFNSLYNARRQFANAENARRLGQISTARNDYMGSIEKAAKSYRRYPSGRWADDALYLIARARFELGEDRAAAAALAELLSKTGDTQMRAGAFAYAGAAALRIDEKAAALASLDSAIANMDRGHSLQGFTRLWRARARAAVGDTAGAWQDLDAVGAGDPEFANVQLERIATGIQSGSAARTSAAFATMLAGDPRRQLDTLSILARHAVARFGADTVRVMLSAPHGNWAAAPRDSLLLLRATITAAAGDTATANSDLQQLAARAALPTASAARIALARARLASITTTENIGELRALLLPAVAEPAAQSLIHTLRLIDVLIQRASITGQPVALFAAAEIARDELRAPLLARQLFITFADIARQTPWAGKALLAAIAIAPNSSEATELRTELAALPSNPYTSAVRGESAEEAYAVAEERLDRAIAAVRDDATRLALLQESNVTRAVATLDSLRSAARADTVRTRCGLMIDTLAIAGVRADSVRVACLRVDTALIARYLRMDTLVLKNDTAKAKMRSDTVIN